MPNFEHTAHELFQQYQEKKHTLEFTKFVLAVVETNPDIARALLDLIVEEDKKGNHAE